MAKDTVLNCCSIDENNCLVFVGVVVFVCLLVVGFLVVVVF